MIGILNLYNFGSKRVMSMRFLAVGQRRITKTDIKRIANVKSIEGNASLSQEADKRTPMKSRIFRLYGATQREVGFWTG